MAFKGFIKICKWLGSGAVPRQELELLGWAAIQMVQCRGLKRSAGLARV
jgi:hypothetical protein